MGKEVTTPQHRRVLDLLLGKMAYGVFGSVVAYMAVSAAFGISAGFRIPTTVTERR